MRDLGRQKDFLLYFNDASAQQATAQLGWDGGLTGGAHDSVLIADASVLSSKLNFALAESADINVDLASGNATHRLTVTYSDVFDTWKKGKDPRLADQVPLPLNEQGIYAQVFVPPSAVLLGLERKEVDGSVSKLQPETQGTFLGYQYFATFFQLALNQEKSLTYTYVAPAFLQIESDRMTYELQFHKQIGVPAYPVTFSVVPPPSYHTVRTAICSEGAKSCAESAQPSGQFDLAADTVIDVEFRRD